MSVYDSIGNRIIIGSSVCGWDGEWKVLDIDIENSIILIGQGQYHETIARARGITLTAPRYELEKNLYIGEIPDMGGCCILIDDDDQEYGGC
jgi:hypothetical protein